MPFFLYDCLAGPWSAEQGNHGSLPERSTLSHQDAAGGWAVQVNPAQEWDGEGSDGGQWDDQQGRETLTGLQKAPGNYFAKSQNTLKKKIEMNFVFKIVHCMIIIGK